MRRRKIITCVIVFLLLGAIVNVAVAWGCAGVTDLSNIGRTGTVIEGGIACESMMLRSAFGSTVMTFWNRVDLPDQGSATQSLDSLLPSWSSINEPTDNFVMGAHSHEMRVDRATGWPALSMHARFDTAPTGPMKNGVVVAVHGGIQARWVRGVPFTNDAGALPLQPIWPGFAINTIFYAAVLWLLFASFAALHRVRRRMKGRCIGCGYDLRGQPPPAEGESTRCPECGRSAAR